MEPVGATLTDGNSRQVPPGQEFNPYLDFSLRELYLSCS